MRFKKNKEKKDVVCEKVNSFNYAVIFNYSFDDDVAVYLFENEEKAKEFLKGSYENELRIDIEENGWYSHGYINGDGTYAKIETIFSDHTDKTEMRIGNIYQ